MLTERVRAQVDGLASGGLDVATFSEAALTVLARAVPFSGACFATADPASGLVTGTVKCNLDDTHDDEWAQFEYTVPDTSAFQEVSRRPGRVLGLHTHTGGDTARSPRFSEFIQRYWNFGDELRAALTVDGRTWGFLALFREEGAGGAFTQVEEEFLSRVTGSLATGLRSGLLVSAAAAPAPAADDGPAVLVVDAAGDVVSASVGAGARIAELGGGTAGQYPLPSALWSLVGAARSMPGSGAPVVPRLRLRTRGGHWVVAHASRMLSRDGTSTDVVLTIEEARPPEIVPLVVAAFGLTPREQDVVSLVLQGVDTSGIAAALHLSTYTVQDHLKSVFTKVGVRSRRELSAKVFFDQYAPRLAAGSAVGASGWFTDGP
jgi:DNA-binding NarL/FixJ family response regulator